MTAQREWFEKNYYEVLGVAEDVGAKDITKAYRKLARQYHPDANPDDATAEERFKEISAAYDVLGDEERRREYDEVRRLGPMGAGFGGPGGPGGGSFRFDAGDLGDLFGNLFGGRAGRPGPGPASGPRRGADLETELHLSFGDAARGVTTTVHVVGDAPCSTCHGRGSRPGTMPERCATCGGAGVVNDNQGLFSFSRPCPACGGQGQVITDPCPTCHGIGVERRGRDVKVRIPAGVGDGQRIRLKGRGAPGTNGGPAGDLFVRVHVDPHALFGRRDRHLTLKVPVTFAEAALGADITVPTLEGEPVTLRLPPGTPSQKTLRVRGRGIQTAKGTGDLLVTVEVVVPDHLSDEERSAVEALAAADRSTPRDHLGV